MKAIIYLLLCFTLFASCVTPRRAGSPKPVKLTSEHALNGTYATRSHYAHNDGMGTQYWENYVDLTRLLGIKDSTEFITLTVESPRVVKASYYTGNKRKEVRLEGKMKKKYFEVYFRKKRIFIPIIYSSTHVDRIRLGKTAKGELYAHLYSEDSGNLLFLAGGGGYRRDVAYTDSLTISDLKPTIHNHQWGYTDATSTFIIPPAYEYASLFEGDVARVKQGGKWGIIDRQGNALTAFKYDEMTPFDTVNAPAISRVAIGEKHGAVNRQGEEVIPVVYDGLGYYFRNGTTEIKQGDKWGIATRSGILYEAVYDKKLNWGQVLFLWDNKKRGNLTGAWAQKDGIGYLITEDGYEYSMVIETFGLINEKRKLVIRDSKKRSTYSK